MPPEDAADPIAQAWENVDRAWSDPESHRRFIALCRALGRLPEAGRRYREVRELDPARRDAAEARIRELLAAATMELELSRSAPPSTRAHRALSLIGAGLMLALMLAAAFAISARG